MGFFPLEKKLTNLGKPICMCPVFLHLVRRNLRPTWQQLDAHMIWAKIEEKLPLFCPVSNFCYEIQSWVEKSPGVIMMIVAFFPQLKEKLLTPSAKSSSKVTSPLVLSTHDSTPYWSVEILLQKHHTGFLFVSRLQFQMRPSSRQVSSLTNWIPNEIKFYLGWGILEISGIALKES